ncbi:MAG: hypothetical protein KKG64_03740 [Firmicutes bacterium]|nr:hypothetical protein [Bacillota bacterium]
MDQQKSKQELFVINYEEKIGSLIEKLEDPLIKYEDKITRYIEGSNKLISKTIHGIEYGASWMMHKHEDFVNQYKSFAMTFYPAARYTAIPWNYIWLYLWKKYRYGEGNLLMVRGVHYFSALQGGGKSSLLYDLAEELRDITHKGSYINTELEKARLDEDSSMMIKHHKVVDLDEFFGLETIIDEDGYEKRTAVQKKQFSTNNFDNLIFDEWLAEMNHRMNNTSAYKEKFIPIMKSLARMRHQGIKRVYIASQLDTADIQLMGLFKYIHDIEIDLDIDYWQWVEDGMFKEHIKGWTIWSYQYKRNKKRAATEKMLIKKWYRKRYSSMEYFDTLNQASTFYSLPMDKIKTTKGII